MGAGPTRRAHTVCICVCAVDAEKRALRTCSWRRMCPRFQDARAGADTGSVYKELLEGQNLVMSWFFCSHARGQHAPVFNRHKLSCL